MVSLAVAVGVVYHLQPVSATGYTAENGATW
jgi:hypothetical protein